MPELITNGRFENWTADALDSWTKPAEDVNNYITENPANHAQMVSDGSVILMDQTITVAPNILYKIICKVTAHVDGRWVLYLREDSNNVLIINLNAVGLFSGFWTSTPGVTTKVRFGRGGGSAQDNITSDFVSAFPYTKGGSLGMGMGMGMDLK